MSFTALFLTFTNDSGNCEKSPVIFHNYQILLLMFLEVVAIDSIYSI
jgi:hypothetical protein